MRKFRIWACSPEKWVQLTPNMFQFELQEWRIDGRLYVNSQFEVYGEWDAKVFFEVGEKPCALMLVERIFRGEPYAGMATIKCTLLRVLDEENWEKVKNSIKNSV